MLIQIITLIILILLSAIFSGIETAFLSVTLVKVHSLVKQKKKGSAALLRLKESQHKLIITILIGNNLVNILAASLATILFTDMFGSNGIGIATGIMTFLILVFGEITPKTFATKNAVRMSLVASRPIEILAYILSPLIIIFEAISKFMSKLLGSKEEKNISEDELKSFVTLGKKEGFLSKEVADMMHNVLKFEGTKVREIMVPDVNVIMIEGDQKLKQVLKTVVKSHYSRYPVYLKDRDNVIGILDVDDILKNVKNNKLNTKVKEIVQTPIFVPETKEIDDLFSEFEGKQIPMAIVVDEYGDVSGLVTLEDILEEIVGEIFDKSKKTNIYIKKISSKTYKVDTKIPVDELNKYLSLELDCGPEFNTLGGYIEHKLQKIPNKGETIDLKKSKATIEVFEVSRKGINSVKITKK